MLNRQNVQKKKFHKVYKFFNIFFFFTITLNSIEIRNIYAHVPASLIKIKKNRIGISSFSQETSLDGIPCSVKLLNGPRTRVKL